MRDGVVDAVEVAVYTIPTDAPEGDGTLTWDSTTMVLVQARSGDTVGLGWTYGPAACATMITDKLAGIVAGRSVLDVGGSFDAMVKAVRNAGRPGAVGYAISAVDVALWDLKARLLDLPLHRLLGAVREKVPVYGSGGFTTYDEAQLHEQLTHWVDEQQIPRVKIKIGESWGGDAVRDLRRMTQARRIIGADVELFVDANGGYGRKQAIRVMHAAADLDVRWFEEPVSSDDLDGLREVRDAVWPDVTAGEYGYDLHYFRRMCAADAVDCLQADVSRCGGITEWLRVSAIAASFGLQVSGHCGPHLYVHAAAATPNLRHLEWFEELRVIGVGAGRAGVHGRRGEPAHLVEQVCFGVVGQVMGLGQGEVGTTVASTSARRVCPIQRMRSSRTSSMPLTLVTAAVAWSTSAGSTASIRRAATWRTAERNTPRIATVMARPMTGSAQDHPRATPPAPSRTARLVNPSVRACSPSATRAAEPMRRPTRMR